MKYFAAFLIALTVMLFIPINAYADELEESIGIDTGEVYDALPPDAENFIGESGITVDNTESMTKIGFADVLRYMWDTFVQKLKYPVRSMSGIVCVIIICSLINGTGDTLSDKKLRNVYGIISTLAAAGLIAAPLSECISGAAQTLTDGSNFMIGYVPVFSGITASSGNVTSAVSYSMAVILASEAVISIASDYIMPVMSVCTALGIIEAVNPSLSLTSITSAVTKAVKFLLGLVMTVFIGLLSLQSIIGTAADSVGVKAAKYMVSNCVPIVGGAVADAYSTLKSGLGILRSGTGFFGIAVLFIIVIPPIMEVIAMRLVFLITETLAELFGIKQIKILAANASSVLSVVFSLMICFSVMFIISTSMLMLTGLNSI